jgi:hypothetical protein
MPRWISLAVLWPILGALAWVGVGGVGGAGGDPVALAARRPGDLVENPAAHLGKTVDVDIVEPLIGPTTAARLATAEYGQVRVDSPDSRSADLSLVPATFRLDDADRYQKRFDRVLLPPLRVRGEFLEDRELSSSGRRRSYVIRVLLAQPLPKSTPIPVGSVADLLRDRARFDRATIEIEGELETRFEVSALEKVIWLARYPDAHVQGAPEKPWGRRRVRVVGVLFAKEGARYGHLGGYQLQLVATRVDDL